LKTIKGVLIALCGGEEKSAKTFLGTFFHGENEKVSMVK